MFFTGTGNSRREALQHDRAVEVQDTKSTDSMQLGPKKLQRPPGRSQTNSDPRSFSNNSQMFMNPSPVPPPYQYPPPTFSPQAQPMYMNPYPAPIARPYIHHVRSEHPTPTLQRLTNFPRHPAQLPPFPAPGQTLPPWTPARTPAPYNPYAHFAISDFAVPIYELPPPDLMDYDMSWMVGIRMLPEWNKAKEDAHWDEVRRMRSAGMQETEGDKDLNCIVM